MQIYLTMSSENAKTGNIPQSYSPSSTCPQSCKLRGAGCYAENYHTQRLWTRLDKGLVGVSWEEFLAKVRKIEPGRLWRHNVAGDVAGDGVRIDGMKLAELTKANRGRKGFTFTHYPLDLPENLEAVQEANARGFTVSLSADTLREADRKAAYAIAPVVAIIPSDPSLWPSQTPEGRRIVVCPAVTHGKTCLECRLCYVKPGRDRAFIVGFPSHGSRKKLVDQLTAG